MKIQTIELLEKEKAKINAEIDRKIAVLKNKLDADFQTFKYKGKEFRIYKWENKPFKDFPMPKEFDWAKYFDFVELINDGKIELEKYPVYYYTKNQFKLNIKNGWSLSRVYLGRGLDLFSGNDGLAGSDGGGRVVLEKL